jgi:hypothetical protein
MDCKSIRNLRNCQFTPDWRLNRPTRAGIWELAEHTTASAVMSQDESIRDIGLL